MNVMVQADHGASFLDLDRVRHAARFALEALGAPSESEVSVTFVSDGEIAALNEEYRGRTGPTDVLSFECDNLDDGFPAPAEGEPYELGDVVIAPDVARRQAAELGVDFLDEIDLLVVHGMLHLNGYDHMTDEDAAVMEPLQERIVADLRLSGRA